VASHPGVESRQQLIEVARELGISERQVRRWRAQGLLPRHIEQEWRGRGMGSQTYYPAGSSRQLREVVRWFERDRRVDVVRWVLWCKGFPVEPDPHERILAGLRRRPTRSDRSDEHSGDFVSRFTEMLRSAAQAAKDLEPSANEDLASLLAKTLRTSDGVPSVGQPLAGEIDRLVSDALRAWEVSDLEKYLTHERLAQLRERAALFYQLWAPERAAVEPLPPRVLVAIIVLNSIGIPIGVVVDYLVHHPEAGDAGQKLRDWLLDDSVWRRPRRRS
jgi:DNA-binding transcriptional MerR regulator